MKKHINSTSSKAILALAMSFLLSFAFVQIYKSEREAIRGFDLPRDYMAATFGGHEPEFLTVLDSFDYSAGGRLFDAKGWAMKVGDANLAHYVDMSFLLRNEQGEYFHAKTVRQHGQDVTDFYDDGTDYNNSRFHARGSVRNLPDGKYQACLLYTEQGGASHLFVYDQYIEVLRGVG